MHTVYSDTIIVLIEKPDEVKLSLCSDLVLRKSAILAAASGDHSLRHSSVLHKSPGLFLIV